MLAARAPMTIKTCPIVANGMVVAMEEILGGGAVELECVALAELLDLEDAVVAELPDEVELAEDEEADEEEAVVVELPLVEVLLLEVLEEVDDTPLEEALTVEEIVNYPLAMFNC